jgi:radical SAM superfamily enzyme YgiQ (UPF0313 family)
MRTPDQIERWLLANEYRMDSPVQYYGTEPNALNRSWDDSTLRWLMAAAWPYEHAAGNQSVPAVVQAITDSSPGYLADRFYLPSTPRDMRLLEQGGIPVFGIESKHELTDFDVVGTSISYLVLFMNFMKYLSISGVPLRWKDRKPEDYPMLMIGGQAYSAPAAMEPVADCLWLGEVEDEAGNGGIGQVCHRIESFKQEGTWLTDRLSCYRELALEFPYLHFPRFVRTHYRYEQRGLPELSRQVSGYESLLPGMAFPRKARKVHDMDQISPLRSAPLLYADPDLGAGDLEVARGCPAWCSFCRLSWVTKPYRQRTTALSVRHAKEWNNNMGSVELSPFSPDFPMHTQRKRLIAQLLEEVNDEADSVAMRVDDFIADGDYILLQALGGMDAVTLGLEGNSQRMRDLVGKGTSDADVVEAVTRAIAAGIRKVKLFMITNLPGEEPEDVMRIVELARTLAHVRDELNQPNVRIQFSWTPLLIEAGTPFQWFAPTHADHTLIKVADAFRELKMDFKVGTKAEVNKVAFFQLCQRGSYEVGEAIVDVLADMDIACWGGVPRDMRDRLDVALRVRGFRNGFGDCFDERSRGDLFGWEYIDTGVSTDLMWDTYQQMVEFLVHTNPATYDEQYSETYHGNEWVSRCDTHCMGKSCGACTPQDLKLRTGYIRGAQAERHIDLATIKPIDQSTVAARIRSFVEKPPELRFVSNAHWRYTVRRAAYQAAAALGLDYSIAKRTITFATDGFDINGTSGVDFVEFGVTRPVEQDEVKALMLKMQEILQPWLAFGSRYEVRAVSSAIRREAAVALYELPADDDPDRVTARLQAWHAADTVPLSLRQDTSYFGLATQEVNAKDYADDIWLTEEGFVKLLTRGLAGPYQLFATLMGRPSWIEDTAQPCDRHAIFTADSTGSAALQGDLLHPVCVGCGLVIPQDLLGVRWHDDYCPRCLDESQGLVLAGLPRAVSV